MQIVRSEEPSLGQLSPSPLCETTRWRSIRVTGLVLPAIMLFAIVATANHYFIDALAGGVLSLTALAFARWPTARAAKSERLWADGR